MTREQRVELCDALYNMEMEIEKARYIMNDIVEAYFECASLEQEKKMIMANADFCKYRAYSQLMLDILCNIVGIMPHSDWAETLKVEEG